MSVDPEYTPRGPTQPGAGTNLVPELAVREALLVGIHELATDRHALRECLARTDELRFSTATEWLADAEREALALLDPASPTCLRVVMGYSEAVARMPAISIELQNDAEDTGEAVINDELHRYHTLRNPSTAETPAWWDPEPTALSAWESMSIRHQVLGVGRTSSLLLGCCDPVVERALMLQALARAALFRQKGVLFGKGVGDVTINGGSITPSPDLEPRLAYLPTLQVSLRWTFRTTRSKIVPNRVTIGAGHFRTTSD